MLLRVRWRRRWPSRRSPIWRRCLIPTSCAKPWLGRRPRQTFSVAADSANRPKLIDKEVERRLLRLGVNGDDVEELQTKLNTAGYNIAVDGIFGRETLKALKDFQKKQGLAVDGIVGDNTYEVLDNITISDTGNTDGEIVRPQTRPEPKTTTKTEPEEFPGISPETKDAIDKKVKDVVIKSTIDKSTRDELNKIVNEPKKKTNKKPKGTTNKSPQVMTKAPKAPSYSAGST